MTGKSRPTLLHLQMGQDVLYVILSFFVIATVLLLLVVLRLWPLQKDKGDLNNALWDARGRIGQLEQQIKDDKKKEGELEAAKEKAERDAGEARNQIASAALNDQPPMISLREADGYSFASGSSALSADFVNLLRTRIVPQLVDAGEKHNAYIVEVVGHTDEQPVRNSYRASTLDSQLLDYLSGRSTRELHIQDNAGLGMARAAAIVQVLRLDPRLALKFQILPMSAGQAIDVGDRPATGSADGTPSAERRRIEIRLRRAR